MRGSGQICVCQLQQENRCQSPKFVLLLGHVRGALAKIPLNTSQTKFRSYRILGPHIFFKLHAPEREPCLHSFRSQLQHGILALHMSDILILRIQLPY